MFSCCWKPLGEMSVYSNKTVSLWTFFSYHVLFSFIILPEFMSYIYKYMFIYMFIFCLFKVKFYKKIYFALCLSCDWISKHIYWVLSRCQVHAPHAFGVCRSMICLFLFWGCDHSWIYLNLEHRIYITEHRVFLNTEYILLSSDFLMTL